MTTMLRIQLLGAFRAVYRDAVVLVDSPVRLHAFIARLVLNPGIAQPRALLAPLFWPDSSPAQARTNLRKLVYQARETFPEAGRFLLLDGPALMWHAGTPYTLDVAEYEHAGSASEFEEAVRLYQGDLLPHCDGEWIVPERERLRHGFTRLLERAIVQAEMERDYPAALRFSQRLVEHDPFHEPGYRHRMRLHALLGERAQAIRIYRECAAFLRRKLGIEPQRETQELYEQLNRPDPASAAQLRGGLPLLGRSREWAQLQAAWQTAAAGQAHAVIVSGEAGVGKTRLAEELHDWVARQGIATGITRCYAVESTLAFAPIAALLRSRPLPHLSPASLAEIARVLPEVLERYPGVRAPGALTEAWQRQHFFQAIARALLATEPLLVIVDDIQWCDRDSIELLHYLLRSAPAARLLLLCTLRAEEIEEGSPLATLSTALRRDGRLGEIELAPLDVAATGELVRRTVSSAVDQGWVQQLVAESEGNPLFAIEMVRAAVDAGITPAGSVLPTTVRSVIAGRLARLSPSARSLAGLAAAIGREFRFEVLQRASGDEDDALARGLDELVQRRIVREEAADGYDFSHAKLREVAYASAGHATRRLFHRRIAEALESLHASDLDAVSGLIAAHFEQGGHTGQAHHYYVRAGDAARRIYANDAAVEAYQHALALTPEAEQSDLLLQVGDIWQLTGRWGAAEAIYRQVLALAERLDDRRMAAHAANALGYLFLGTGSYPEALVWLEQARDEWEALGDRQGLGKAIGGIGSVYHRQGDHPQALEYLQAHLEIATATGNRREACGATAEMGEVYWTMTDFERAHEALNRGLEIATEIDDRPRMIRVLSMLAGCYWAQGDYDRATTYLERELQLATEIGDRRSMADVVGHIGIVHYRRGDYALALAAAEQLMRLAVELGAPQAFFPTAANTMGEIYAKQGAHASMLACAALQLQIGIESEARLIVALALNDIAAAYAEQGEYQEAERRYRQSIAIYRLLDLPHMLWQALHQLAELYVRRQRYAAAEVANEEALREASRAGIKKHQIKLRVLAIRLRVALGACDIAVATGELEHLLQTWTEELEQAELHYAIWCLHSGEEAHRAAALALYQRAHARAPDWEYRQRLAKLGADLIPDAPVLPDLPEIVTRHTEDLATLLLRADHYIARLVIT